MDISRMGWSRTFFKLFFILLVLIPVLIIGVIHTDNIFNEMPEPGGDGAVLLIHTIHASRGSQLVGPYSRSQWSHPGPILYYIITPIYLLSGKHPASLAVNAVLLNLISVILILVICLRAGGFLSFLLVALLTSLFLYYLGSALASLWNPYITILPFCVFVFVCSEIALGRIRILPLVGIIGTFIIQTHVLYFPISVLLLFSSLIMFWFLPKSKKITPKVKAHSFIRSIIISVVILSLLWFLPLMEQLKNDPGNMTKIFDYFTEDRPTQNFSNSLKMVSRHVSAIPLALCNKPQQPLTGAAQTRLSMIFLIVLLLCLPFCAIISTKMKHFFISSVSILSEIGLLAALISV
ncbi:hypothetical protein ACFL27_28805, partial [candidate division CSSED10-310 bacterium]